MPGLQVMDTKGMMEDEDNKDVIIAVLSSKDCR